MKAFEDEVKKVRLGKPIIPYISNITGTWITGAQATDPYYWASHANHTARFSDALHELWRYTNPILLEIGPGRTLSVLALQHPEKPPAGDPVVVSSVRYQHENESDSDVMLRGLGTLEITGEEALDPEMATVLGPCGVIPKEFPQITCFNIDLPGGQVIDDLPNGMCARILAEFP